MRVTNPGCPWNTRHVSGPPVVPASEYQPGRWGRPGQTGGIPASVRSYLDEHVGTATPWPVHLPDLSSAHPCRLDGSVVEELSRIVGPSHVMTAAADRWRALGGASYLDYVRQRGGDVAGLPDAVVTPADHAETQAAIEVCSTARVAIVAAGGGTSVVGGLAVAQPHVMLSTSRMRSVFDIDEVSGLVSVGPGITGPALEAVLAARGLTLGHLPQSWQRASIGGYVATRSAGQASTGFGRSDDMVESVTLATPAGSWDIGHTPASAAGPDLLQVAVGSEGAFGVVTRVSLRVRRAPNASRYEAWIFPDLSSGTAAFRELAQLRIPADVMRLSDAEESATTLLMSAPGGLLGRGLDAYLGRRGVQRGSACLSILGWHAGTDAIVDSRRTPAIDVLRRHGAVWLGRRPGRSWLRHRFDGPHLRDALLDAGYLVETVETSTRWAQIEPLREAIHGALKEALTTGRTRPYVMTHVSHVYETGASLYTTVIAVADRADPVGQWGAAKRAVSEAIVSGGGTITHHHAVGRDHAPWLAGEIGERGIDVLQAVKSTLDPNGVCNPGVLGLN